MPVAEFGYTTRMTKSDKHKSEHSSNQERRARRLSDEEASDYKEKRRLAEEEETASPERPAKERAGGGKQFRKNESADKYNVHLYLSPRMLQLAEELADEAGIPTQRYLVEAIKYVLLAQAGRVGARDRYAAEFTSKAKKRTGTWKADSEKQQLQGAEGGRSQGREGDFGGA